MEKKKRRSREASSSLPVTRPHLDPAGHSGMRKDILGVLLCQAWSHPAPIMPVIMEPPPECPWTHFTLEGRSRTELFVDATEAEFLLEFLGGPGPCCHLCVLSSYNSLWQLICLSNLISKYNSNCHVRHLMHPLHTHMRVHVFQMLMSRQRSDGVGLVQGEGLYFN